MATTWRLHGSCTAMPIYGYWMNRHLRLIPKLKQRIFAELKENLKGRIGIVISHRFSTVRIADRIAVIDDGRVTELGTHEELLAAGNRYAQLFELQASGYR